MRNKFEVQLASISVKWRKKQMLVYNYDFYFKQASFEEGKLSEINFPEEVKNINCKEPWNFLK